MIRLMSITNKTFHSAIPVTVLYANPAIESAANHAAEAGLATAVKAELARLEAAVIAAHPTPHLIEHVYPMSDIQLGMVLTSELMRQQNEPGIYHEQFVSQPGLINIPLLTRAMQLMTEKHETLRTSFHLHDYEKQVQIIHREVPVAIRFEDVSEFPAERKESYIRDFMVHERIHHPFDVTQAPLWRINVFQINHTEVMCIFQFHHAIIDGCSEKKFRMELFEIYHALEANINYRPTPLLCSMYDSVVSDMAEPGNQENVRFWEKEMNNYRRLGIFTDEITDEEMNKGYDPDYSTKLLDKCREDGIEPKALFFSAYLYVMGLLTWEQDITAGLVTHRRPLVEDGDKLMGCFLNSIPFRFNFANTANASWLNYIRTIDTTLRERKGRERFSLNGIATLAGESTGRNPFFDVLFNYVELHGKEDAPSKCAEREPERIRFRDFERAGTYLDFTWSVTGKRVQVKIINTRKLRSKHTLKELMGYFDNFLQNYLYHADEVMDSIRVMAETERQQLLFDFNATSMPYPDATLVSLFDKQVAATPDAPALVFESTTLSYRQLAHQAACFAAYLSSVRGVQPRDLVALKPERNEWAVIAILGILKTGAAYMPADPAFPAERMADSCCKMCVDQSVLSDFTAAATAPVTTVEIMPDSLAYVMYTSGSTGIPKGVMIAHRQVVNTILAQISAFHLEQYQRCLQFASFSFDASVSEIFTTLLSGACLYIIDEKRRNDPQLLADYIQQTGIDFATLPPSYLQLIDLNKLKGMKGLVTAGDVPAHGDVKAYLQLGTGSYFNAYGPTETSICATILEVPDRRELEEAPVAIGKPIANTSIFILNELQQVRPVGVSGEICIGGNSVATGYLNRSDLTADKFIPHPLMSGERLFRTGDLGKWLPDGNIVFTGRKETVCASPQLPPLIHHSPPD